MCFIYTPFHTPCSHTSPDRISEPCAEITRTAPVISVGGPHSKLIRPHYPPLLDVGCRFNVHLGQENVEELCPNCLKREVYQRELSEEHGVDVAATKGITFRFGDYSGGGEEVVTSFKEVVDTGVTFGVPKEQRELRRKMIEKAKDGTELIVWTAKDLAEETLALRQKWIEQDLQGEEPLVWKSSREERRKDRAEAKRRAEVKKLAEEQFEQDLAARKAKMQTRWEDSQVLESRYQEVKKVNEDRSILLKSLPEILAMLDKNPYLPWSAPSPPSTPRERGELPTPLAIGGLTSDFQDLTSEKNRLKTNTRIPAPKPPIKRKRSNLPVPVRKRTKSFVG
ncbi:hypothetical protein HYALB_00010841 [Hymenoscyphus albidus]|uniref:Uncharacterized protein n=1 Tax=Hymenoscyphus albidus TaxID=595503 RepID=A0A9N9LF97_9HELO|nr:hypothetical protein HYALB_00010841 [Hymenoscyphus albidus]